MSVTPGSTIPHDPAESLFYVFDWSDWLVAAATIASSTFTLTGPDAALTKDNPDIITGSDEFADATATTVRLTGGTASKTYTLTNTVVTNESPSQTGERSVKITIRNR